MPDEPTEAPKARRKKKATRKVETPVIPAVIKKPWVDYCGNCDATKDWLQKTPFGQPLNPQGFIECIKCGQMVSKAILTGDQ
jgi:hypothetical protein